MRQRRQKPVNGFVVTVLVALIAFVTYVNVVIGPTIRQRMGPTPTITRNPETYLTEAEALFNEGRLAQAIEIYSQVILLTPADPGVYIALARLQLFSGQYQEALTNAENALLLNPNNSMAHALRGSALIQLGEYLRAEAPITRALEIEPANGIAHAFRAELLGNMYLNNIGPFDVLDQAIVASRDAVQLAPSAIESHRARGFILEITQNYEEAIQEYQAAITINAHISELHLSLGRMYRATNQMPMAVEEYTLANTLNPSDPRPDLYTSRVYIYTGDYAKAAQYAQQAVQDDLTDGYLRGNWGLALSENFQFPDAVTQLSLAIYGGADESGAVVEPVIFDGGDGRITEYYYTYALLLARSQRCGETLSVAQQILGTVPNDEVAVYNAQEALRLCAQNLEDEGREATSEPASQP
jgi:tetratricopeptide (TPR) repeat protein